MKEPSIRQKALALKIVENRGNVSKSMKEVGYSEKYAHNPQQLKATLSWAELLERDLPDDLLSETAKAGLKATTVDKNGMVVDDYSVRQRYLETSLKMKNKITEKVEVTGTVVGINFTPPNDRNNSDDKTTT